VTPVLHTAPVVLALSDAGSSVLRDGAVLIDRGLIVDCGPATEVARRAGDSVRRRDHRGVLTPGLVNAHSHLQYSAYADFASLGLPFSEWIGRMVQRRATTTAEEWSEAARIGAHLAIRSGTTAAADIVTDGPALAPLARSGLRGPSYVEALGADDAQWDADRRREVTDLVDAAPSGRAVGVSPHTLYTLSRRAFAEANELARARGLRIHTHLAESADEVEFVATGSGLLAEMAQGIGWDLDLIACGGTGRTPAEELDALGGLGSDVHVAHGVHCTASDRALLRERGTAVAVCVRSNRILGAGEPPLADYLAEGSVIGLGTDSLASSPSLDLWDEALAARELARRQGYDDADLERRLVEAVTTGGAAAMGLAGRSGVLAEGAHGDVAVFDVPTEAWDDRPYDPFRALVELGSGRCTATVINGTLMHRR
jgi:cytosine/adenosine deaminase-related metal-dependent hydrolase